MWRYAAAKTIGTSHLRSGASCQDSYAVKELRPGTLFVALADGAGSASQGEDGAKIAVKAAMNLEYEESNGTDLLSFVKSAVQDAQAKVMLAAKEASMEPREFATTFLALLLNDNGGAAAQIGDGVIAVRRHKEEWQYLFWPQHGEYVNTTRFLTDEDMHLCMQTQLLEDRPQDAVIFSDGLDYSFAVFLPDIVES